MKIIHEIINRGKGTYGAGQTQITRDDLLRIYDETRSISTLTLTTSGSTGPAVYNPSIGTLNIPVYSNQSLNDLLDVNISGAIQGQALVLGPGGIWSAQTIGPGSSITIDDNPPADPEQGDQWLHSLTGILYTWVIDASAAGQWVELGPDGAGDTGDAGTYVAGTGLTLTGNVFSANIGTSIQAWDADLDAIAGLSGTSGYLIKTGANTWSLDTSTHYSRDISVMTTTQSIPLNSGVDHIILAANTITLTLPTAVLNESVITIKNTGTGTITVNTTSSQTIDGSTSITLPVRYTSLSFVSDGSNWNII